MKSNRYCILPAKIKRLDENRAALHCLTDDRQLIVPLIVAQVFRLCTKSLTLEELTAETARKLTLHKDSPQQATPDCRGAIDALVAAGFIVKESDLPISGSPTEHRSRQLFDVAIVTRDRTSSLDEAITGIECDARSFDRNITISVYDDSRDARSCETTLNLLKMHRSRDVVNFRYSSRPMRKDYAAALSRVSGVESAIVDFALNGYECGTPTTGSARNSALLDLIDKPFLFLDDDIRLPVITSRVPVGEVRLTSKRSPVKTTFHSDLITAIKSVQSTETSVLDAHEKYLGKSIQDLALLPVGKDLVLDCKPELWFATLSGTGKISATQMGIAGHSGLSSPTWILTSLGENRRSIIDIDEAYRLARNGRYVSRIAPGLTISDSRHCMTYALGLDNLEYLPPFLPVGRNSDGVFGALLRIGNSSRHIGHLPCGVIHYRECPPFADDEIWRDASRIRISDLLLLILDDLVLRRPGIGVPYTAELSQLLLYISALKDREMMDILKNLTRKRLERRLLDYDRVLERYHHWPRHWAEDLYRARVHLADVVRSRRIEVPCDLSYTKDANSAASVRHVLKCCGGLLLHWSALRESARVLKRDCQGIEIARSVV
jgi:hypothetical protein